MSRLMFPYPAGRHLLKLTGVLSFPHGRTVSIPGRKAPAQTFYLERKDGNMFPYPAGRHLLKPPGAPSQENQGFTCAFDASRTFRPQVRPRRHPYAGCEWLVRVLT